MVVPVAINTISAIPNTMKNAVDSALKLNTNISMINVVLAIKPNNQIKSPAIADTLGVCLILFIFLMFRVFSFTKL